MAENENNEELRENFFVKLAKRIKSEISKAVSGKLDKSAVVAPASDMAFSGKAADAYEIGNALPLFFNNDPAKALFRFGDHGEPILDQLNYDARYHFPANVEGDLVLALVSQLSGITAQDITDFLKYRGVWVYFDDIEFYEHGEIVYHVDGYYSCHDASARYEWNDPAWVKYTPTEGFLKLVELYGKNKALLFADTAFRTKVEEIIDEHGGGGGGDMKFVLKYNSEKDVIYFDDGVNA